jgi:hypothetical protein
LAGANFAPHDASRIKRRFDADHVDRRLQRLQRSRNSRQDAAAADGDDHGVKVRRIGKQLDPDGALAGDDLLVVIGMDEDQAFALGHLAGEYR